MFQSATQKPSLATLRSNGVTSSLTGKPRKMTNLESGSQSTTWTECSPVTYADTGIGPPRLEIPLNTRSPAPRDSRHPCDTTSIPHNARADRRWDSPPLLQFGEGALVSREDNKFKVEGVFNDLADTEEVLNSLQPEQLSLHHVRLPRHAANDLVSTENDHRLTDNHSICKGEWGFQPYVIDEQNAQQQEQQQEQQQKLVRRQSHDGLVRHGVESRNIITNSDTLNKLSEEDTSTPEAIFYANLIEIVRDYHKQMNRVVQISYATGETSKDRWLREKWRHRSAMDRRVLDAERVSGYKVLTDKNDVRQAIKRPLGYAIYSSLYQIRDPAAWQRIVKSDPAKVRDGCFTRLACEIGRALQSMFAVPDDSDLNTESDRHANCSRNITYHLEAGNLNADISPRLQLTDGSALSNPPPLQPIQYSKAARKRSWPCTYAEQCPKVSNNDVRMDPLVLFPNTILSPVDSSFSEATSSRGYEQGAFVTVLDPFAVSFSIRRFMTQTDTGNPVNTRTTGDEEGCVTPWPLPD